MLGVHPSHESQANLAFVLRRRKAVMAAWALALLAQGCATYRPLPLPEPSAVLSEPQLAALSRDAAAIERPYLTPRPIDFSAPLDGNAIAALAVLNNPDLKALRARAGVADAQAFAAGLLPDPTISIGFDQVVSGPDTVLGIASSLAASLGSLRTRAAARAQASAAARQVRLDLAWAEWQTAGQARIQAARAIALRRIVRIDRESSEAAQALLDAMLRAAGRGDLLPDRLQGARVAAVDAAERLRNDERDLTAAERELARLIGFPPDFPLQIAETPPPPPPPDAARLFALATDNRTDLSALRAGYGAQEAAVRQAILEQFPTLDLSINPARDTAGNVTIGPSLSLTLPIWNRNRGGIAIAQATREALRSEYSARLFQTRAEIFAAAGSLAVLRRQREALLAGIPPLRRFAEANRRAAARGDLAPATAATAEQTLRDRLLLLAQVERDILEQSIALELLTGTPQETWTR